MLEAASPAIKRFQWRRPGLLRIFLLHVFSTPGLVLFSSCELQSEYVYVAGPGFQETLTVSLAAADREEQKVNQWLELKATRRTGPWVKRKKSSALQPRCWWLRPPPEVEENAQGNVTWHAEPKDPVEFNIPTTADLHKRMVRFSKPGLYKLWASSTWCGEPCRSNVIEIIVR